VSELNRLREGNDLAARLLRAGSREQPRQTARQRAERALGLSTVAASAALTSTATATVGAAGVGASAPFALATFAKWIAVGMLAGGTLAGGASAVHDTIEPSRARALDARASSLTGAASEITHAPQAPAERAAADPAPIATTLRTDPHPAGASQAVDPRHLLAAPTALTSPPTSERGDDALPRTTAALALSREVELLEHVRAKLRAGNSGQALAELDTVRADIKTLVMEADLLRVEALLAHGERARAEALAAELQRRDPHGGQNFRLKRLFGGP
jgi:hypothetical protein